MTLVKLSVATIIFCMLSPSLADPIVGNEKNDRDARRKFEFWATLLGYGETPSEESPTQPENLYELHRTPLGPCFTMVTTTTTTPPPAGPLCPLLGLTQEDLNKMHQDQYLTAHQFVESGDSIVSAQTQNADMNSGELGQLQSQPPPQEEALDKLFLAQNIPGQFPGVGGGQIQPVKIHTSRPNQPHQDFSHLLQSESQLVHRVPVAGVHPSQPQMLPGGSQGTQIRPGAPEVGVLATNEKVGMVPEGPEVGTLPELGVGMLGPRPEVEVVPNGPEPGGIEEDLEAGIFTGGPVQVMPPRGPGHVVHPVPEHGMHPIGPEPGISQQRPDMEIKPELEVGILPEVEIGILEADPEVEILPAVTETGPLPGGSESVFLSEHPEAGIPPGGPNVGMFQESFEAGLVPQPSLQQESLDGAVVGVPDIEILSKIPETEVIRGPEVQDLGVKEEVGIHFEQVPQNGYSEQPLTGFETPIDLLPESERLPTAASLINVVSVHSGNSMAQEVGPNVAPAEKVGTPGNVNQLEELQPEIGGLPSPPNPLNEIPTMPEFPEFLPPGPSGTELQFPNFPTPDQNIPSIPPPELPPNESIIDTMPVPDLPSLIPEVPTPADVPQFPIPIIPGFSPQLNEGVTPGSTLHGQPYVEPSNPAETEGMKETCAGLPPGPFIPPGYFPVDSEVQQETNSDQCGLTPVTLVDCDMMEVFEQLRLRVIYNLIIEAGLENLFTEPNGYTFFAPVDQAFDLLPAWFMQSLYTDKNLLVSFITNHIIKIELPLSSVGSEFLVMNFRGNRVRINVYDQDSDYRVYTVDGSRILQGGIKTTTGLIHIVQKVIMPNARTNIAEYLQDVPDFSNFFGAVRDAGILPYLAEMTPYTIFIPINRAFNSLNYAAIAADRTSLQHFVNFHIINETYFSPGLLHGEYLLTNYLKEIKVSVCSDGYSKFLTMVNGMIRVIKSDIPVGNGVAHIIDNCIMSDENFFKYEELSEFSNEFGAFRRKMVLSEDEIRRDSF